MKIFNSRAVAIDILCKHQQTGKSIDLLIDQGQDGADSRDRHLVKAIVFGVLRQRQLLDWVISRFSKHPVQKIKTFTLQALRTGVFQLLFMDKMPPSAVINETIKALKARRQPRWLTGFANGVLRNIDRQRLALLAEIAAGKMPEGAALNHPEWLLERWQQRYGAEATRSICQSNNQAAQLCLRINTAKIPVEAFMADLLAADVEAAGGSFLPEAIWLAPGSLVNALPGYGAGHFMVQDEIAQLICYLFAPYAVGNYLDACAGLGGKTLTLDQLLPKGSRVVAVEPDVRRQRLQRENFSRMGSEGIETYPGTLQEFAKVSSDKFEAVLVDAPCSGLGVAGRHPDIRWNRHLKDLLGFQKRQLELLHSAAKLMKSGGVLVYATCSMEPEENEEVIDQFLSGNQQFVIEDAKKHLPESAASLVDGRGMLRSIPGEICSDGFFAARLRSS